MTRNFFILLFAVGLIGCQKENPTETIKMEGQTLSGTFEIVYNKGTSQEYSEQGTLSMSFESSSYHYIGAFQHTSTGRGRIFRDGIGDKGNYTLAHNRINLNDRAVIYGSGKITGSPSLYLSGGFQVLETGRTITLIKEENQRTYKITLSR